jgi:glycine hydroxymethyltransferase
MGTAALTTLGMKKAEMKEIADILFQLLKTAKVAIDPKTKAPSRSKLQVEEPMLRSSRERVKDLLEKFPLYPELIVD